MDHFTKGAQEDTQQKSIAGIGGKKGKKKGVQKLPENQKTNTMGQHDLKNQDSAEESEPSSRRSRGQSQKPKRGDTSMEFDTEEDAV